MLTEVKSSQSAALPGTPGGQYMETRVFRNAEASDAIKFGWPVVASSSNADDCTIADATTSLIAGFVIRDDKYYADLENTDAGLLPGVALTVMERGEMQFLCESAMAPGDRVYVRVVAGVGETIGAVRATADGTDCVDCTAWARVVAKGAVGNTCRIKFDTLFVQAAAVSAGA